MAKASRRGEGDYPGLRSSESRGAGSSVWGRMCGQRWGLGTHHYVEVEYTKDAKPGKPGTETMELEPECIHEVQPSGLQVASNKVKDWQE